MSKTNKKLIERSEKANILFRMVARLYRYIFDYRNGDLSYSDLKIKISKEMKNVEN